MIFRLGLLAVVVAFFLYLFGFDFANRGFQVRIPTQEVLNFYSSKFPVKKDFEYGEVVLQKPLVLDNQNDDRIHFKMNLAIKNSTLSLGAIATLSSSLYFDSETKTLKPFDVQVEEIKFNNDFLNLIPQSILTNLIESVIEAQLEQKKLYNFREKNPFLSRFMRDVKIENGNIVAIIGF